MNYGARKSLWRACICGLQLSTAIIIFCDFMERPGIFTKKELMNWKSLEGRVRLVKVFKAQSCRILMAFVNPSQRNSIKYAHTQL